MYNCAIIGVGVLGKRHFESLAKSQLSMKIYCIDPNQKALDEITKGGLYEKKKIIVGVDVSVLPTKLDVVIIATSSGVRRFMFDSLLEQSCVENIVFEKVLFQRVEDYYYVAECLKKNNIKAWVNCVRREWNSYHELKKELDACNQIEVHISGSQWGLGCNLIHMVDLIGFLAENDNCKIDRMNLLPEVVNSKRVGYKEVFGSVVGTCGKCNMFTISCYPDGEMPLFIEIACGKVRYIVKEEQKKLEVIKYDSEIECQERFFSTYYQSQLTQGVIESILKNGECRLTEYASSMKLHLACIEPLIKFFEEQGMEEGLCPIT